MTIKSPVEHNHQWICALDHNYCFICGVTEGAEPGKSPEPPVTAAIRAKIIEIQDETEQI